jgi:hypothetical protein
MVVVKEVIVKVAKADSEMMETVAAVDPKEMVDLKKMAVDVQDLSVSHLVNNQTKR